MYRDFGCVESGGVKKRNSGAQKKKGYSGLIGCDLSSPFVRFIICAFSAVNSLFICAHFPHSFPL